MAHRTHPHPRPPAQRGDTPGADRRAALGDTLGPDQRAALGDAPEADRRRPLGNAPEAEQRRPLDDTPEADQRRPLDDTPGPDQRRPLDDAPVPDQRQPPRDTPGLAHFNAADQRAAVATLLTCCRSRRWARLVAEHRPYPDLDALLAAGDEASFDLTPADLSEALAAEPSIRARPDARPWARIALTAAHEKYQRTFHHSFVIALDDREPTEHLDRVLADIHRRLSNEPEREREIAAEELRGLARSRLARLIADPVGRTPSESFR
ncbi:2-oxo-4-hydroxy-4-carboxy-5-ureidoimidazoline decarboxylase [Streptomyces katsurahamanus]|uniref:2-oxo-4-hydroxy-4-carboxy-5-ureidoimidazoline decarboxylase n=1 Tax=Streptomyces katsurahamanus TaxID=2577098 RepID=UPI002B21F33F|nr:2-oxo-4-hydroxy-4-carboxy-5-ureidoimidazoline decarboxylase [Streptomyces katsurahamanus]